MYDDGGGDDDVWQMTFWICHVACAAVYSFYGDDFVTSCSFWLVSSSSLGPSFCVAVVVVMFVMTAVVDMGDSHC